ncbi:MAG: type III-B CRISPR module RAMP protein Cmr4 [bacterium JZ-2024 1]
MFDKSALVFMYCESPIHCGSGTSLGIVDLPIQRERYTGYPIVQASGIKGCFRDAVGGQHPECVEVIFGPEPPSASAHAGALSVGDARILLFPVRSLRGVFAWVTSREVLARFSRDAELAGIHPGWSPVGPSSEDKAYVPHESTDILVDSKVVLEEFAFQAEAREEVKKIADWLAANVITQGDDEKDGYRYWREALKNRLVILPETAFRDFTLLSTEVISRVRLDDTRKAVAQGALWTEELLPSETVLYTLLFASKPRIPVVTGGQGIPNSADEVLQIVKNSIDKAWLQIGGNSTVGRGFVKVRVLEG